MIVVIADDLSGAAELAGAAVQQGLSAEVQTSFDPESDAEVVCVDTDSRLLAPAVAAERVADVARRVMAAKPAWIFKKCDSLLRGPVLAEARAVAATAGRARVLLVPANPSRDRTISAGLYRVAGRPLHEMAFARDPLHPRLTSDVKVLLGGDLARVSVPDITTAEDVQRQVRHADSSALPAGGVDFFTALLTARTPRRVLSVRPVPVVHRTLVVCGSEMSWLQRCCEADAGGVPIFSLPHDTPAVISALGENRTVLLGIGNGPATRDLLPQMLTEKLARSVVAIMGQIRVERLLLEGGATASAIIAALGWTRLRAEPANLVGVGLLRPVASAAPPLTIKPGSYHWPTALWP